MAGIWSETEHGWRALAPVGFGQEKELHELIERNPGMLPLAGTPRLVVLGREVRCGKEYADLIAVEADTGVPVIIEIKLASNTDRRLVLTQVLGYAAYLRRLDASGIGVLMGPHLAQAHFGSIVEAVATAVEDPSFEDATFTSNLEEAITSGRLRCVIVIDEAPPDVVELVGYLQEVSNDRLSLDLVSVSAYQIGDRRVLVPQLVEPERAVTTSMPVLPRSSSVGQVVTPGAQEFAEGLEDSPAEHQAHLRLLLDWALALETNELAVLRTARGKMGLTLRVHLPGQQRGLVAIWNDEHGAHLAPYRTVFEQESPTTLELLDERWPGQIKQGNYIDLGVLHEILEVITAAYRESRTSGVIEPI